MAKYDITYQCGCTETVQLYGPGKERERKIAQMESHVCPACRAKAANDVEGMATLTGSDKQIAWAGDIRNNLIDTANRQIQMIDEAMAENIVDHDQAVTVRIQIKATIDAISKIERASKLIDMRNYDTMEIYNAIVA